MMNTISELKTWLEEVDLLHDVDDSDEAIQAMLNLRNSTDFNRHYNRALSISRPPKNLPLTNQESSQLSEIIQLARMKTLKLSSISASELAPYVTDDFFMFVHAIRAGLEDPWIKNLFDQYKEGRFPCRALI